jgi:hypothetical protein
MVGIVQMEFPEGLPPSFGKIIVKSIEVEKDPLFYPVSKMTEEKLLKKVKSKKEFDVYKDQIPFLYEIDLSEADIIASANRLQPKQLIVSIEKCNKTAEVYCAPE